MPNMALITGASSGIGMEFARYHASKGGDVILTARRKDALDALASEVQTAHNVTAHVFALDLGAEGGAQALYDQVKAAGLSVDILINNAGFGGQGRFLDRDLADDRPERQSTGDAVASVCQRHGGERWRQDPERRLDRRVHARPVAGDLFRDQGFRQILQSGD